MLTNKLRLRDISQSWIGGFSYCYFWYYVLSCCSRCGNAVLRCVPYKTSCATALYNSPLTIYKELLSLYIIHHLFTTRTAMALFTGRGIRGHARVESRDSDTLTPLTDFSPRYEHYRSDSNPYFNTYDGLRTPDFDRSRTPEPFVQSPPFAEAIPDSEDAPLRRATPQPYRRGVSADDYTSPKLPPIRPRPRERKRFAWKWPSRTGLILKFLFCFSAFVAYAYLYFLPSTSSFFLSRFFCGNG